MANEYNEKLEASKSFNNSKIFYQLPRNQNQNAERKTR